MYIEGLTIIRKLIKGNDCWLVGTNLACYIRVSNFPICVLVCEDSLFIFLFPFIRVYVLLYRCEK